MLGYSLMIVSFSLSHLRDYLWSYFFYSLIDISLVQLLSFQKFQVCNFQVFYVLVSWTCSGKMGKWRLPFYPSFWKLEAASIHLDSAVVVDVWFTGQ